MSAYRKKTVINLKRLTPLITGAFVLFIALFPDICAKAAKTGVELWLFTAFPAIFPFMTGALVLLKTGASKALGNLLSPVMRPLFDCPGESAYVLVMGAASGNPAAARLCAELVETGRMTPAEMQRTLVFSSTASPLFILGAVAAGMLGNAAYGPIIAIAHYSSALLCGLLLCRTVKNGALPPRLQSVRAKPLPAKPRNVLMESIKDAMQVQLVIGGTIVFFSVVIALLSATGLLAILGSVFSLPLSLFGISPALVAPFMAGLVEATNGCSIAAAAGAPPAQTVAVITAVISFGGLSIAAQSSSFFPPGVKIGFFLLAKAAHALLSAAICALIFPLIAVASVPASAQPPGFVTLLAASGLNFAIILALLSIALLIVRTVSKRRKKENAP